MSIPTYAAAPALAALGYHPIPISTPKAGAPADGKRPAEGYPDWPTWSQEKLHHHTTGFAGHAFASCGIGMLGAVTPAIDIDVLHADTANAIEALVRDCLGDSQPLFRQGQAPKCLLVCRADEPLHKIKTKTYRLPTEPELGPDFKGHAVEVLGAGQQFVAFGIHPGTKKPYSWFGKTPFDVPLADLPLLTQAAADDLITRIDALFVARGYVVAGGTSAQPGGGTRLSSGQIRDDHADIDDIRSAVAAIPNPDLHYDEWVRTGMAIAGALGAAGLELFVEWSSRSAKHDEATARQKYATFRPTQIGAGTVFQMAQDHGWKWPPRPGTPDAAAPSAPPQRSRVRLRVGEESADLDVAEAGLIAYGTPVYQRGANLVIPTVTTAKDHAGNPTPITALHALDIPAVADHFSEALVFERWKAADQTWVRTGVPAGMAAAYASRVGRWRVPVLRGVIHAPTLRADGSILQTPGYDPQTELLYEPRGATFPPVPDRPTHADAVRAGRTLKRLLAGFPFDTPRDRAVALSALLTILIRTTLPTAPLHAFTSPTAATGKSKLVDCANMLAAGTPAAVIAPGGSEEELEKRLAASLLSGVLVISLDNCPPSGLDSVMLCQVLSQEWVVIRVLGASDMRTLPSMAMLCATGNNLVIKGDLSRRAVLCRIDAKCERPELRVFAEDCVDVARRDRAALVVAALTILRAHAVAAPASALRPLGSFEVWSRRVRDALVWIGEPDICSSLDAVRATDPQLAALQQMVAALDRVYGARPMRTSDILAASRETVILGGVYTPCHPDLHEAVQVAARGREITSLHLGHWLNHNSGRMVRIGERELRIVEHGRSGGVVSWVLKGEK